jgi:hypothetical protein
MWEARVEGTRGSLAATEAQCRALQEELGMRPTNAQVTYSAPCDFASPSAHGDGGSAGLRPSGRMPLSRPRSSFPFMLGWGGDAASC